MLFLAYVFGQDSVDYSFEIDMGTQEENTSFFVGSASRENKNLEYYYFFFLILISFFNEEHEALDVFDPLRD